MSVLLFAALVFISDVQINHYDPYPTEQATLISTLIGNRTVYDCGDLAENGLMSEYAIYQSLFPQSIPVPGNHDIYTQSYFGIWARRFETMDEGVHIVGFDTNERFDPDALIWLRQALDDGDGTPTILILHHQLFSGNVRNGGIAGAMRPIFLPIIEETGVDLVISGHGHAYERHESGGRTFLVIGGAGAPLDPVVATSTLICTESCHHWLEVTPQGGLLSCVVFRCDGSVADAFTTTTSVSNEALTWTRLKQLYR